MPNSKGTRTSFGYLTQLPSGRYRASYVGPDKQRHACPDGTFKTKGAAEAWLASERTDIQRGVWQDPILGHEARLQANADEVERVTTTFGTYFEEVLARRIADGKIRETTAALYRKLYRLHIEKTFAKLPVTQITAPQVRKWSASMASTPSSRKNAYGVLGMVMTQAVKDGIINFTPCTEPPAKPQGRTVTDEGEVLEPEVFAKYVAAIPEEHGYRMAVKIGYYCGLRNAEIRGLRRCDVNLKTKELTVTQQVVKLNGKNVESSMLKTPAGARVVAIPSVFVPELMKWLKKLPADEPTARLFNSPTGLPMSGEALRAAAKIGANAIGRPNLRVHSLRHTSATMAARAGATTSELMGRMGWKSSKMPEKYSHATRNRDRVIADNMF